MTKQTEALRLALEALDSYGINDYSDYVIGKHETHIIDNAITAIKEALAQPEQEPYGYLKLNTGKFFNEVEGLNPMTDKRYLPLYTKQEPAATSQATYNKICLGLAEAGCRLSEQQKMALASLVQDTSPPQPKEPEQRSVSEHLEPVAVLFDDGSIVKCEDLQFVPEKSGQRIQMLYLTPYVATPRPQRIAAEGEDSRRAWVEPREWRGLTNDERMEIYSEALTIWSCMEAIEAKLKEKNT